MPCSRVGGVQRTNWQRERIVGRIELMFVANQNKYRAFRRSSSVLSSAELWSPRHRVGRINNDGLCDPRDGRSLRDIHRCLEPAQSEFVWTGFFLSEFSEHYRSKVRGEAPPRFRLRRSEGRDGFR